MRTRTLLSFTALAFAGLALAGCTTSLTVSAEDAATQAASALAPQLGYTPEIVCPEDLKGEVNAELTCELTDDQGNVHDAILTVTGIDDTDVAFDVSVPTLSAP